MHGISRVSLCVGVGVLIALVALRYEQQHWTSPTSVTTLHVTRGMTGHRVVQILQPTWPAWRPRIIFRIHPELANIQEGRYQWSEGLGTVQVLEKMVIGDSMPSRVTLIEGSTIAEAWARVSAHPDVQGKTVPAWSQWLQAWNSPFPHPEGAFLAETFLWQGTIDAEVLFRRAHDALVEGLEQAWSGASPATKAVLKTPYEALILASIVEKETALAAERGLIARVFLSRLAKGMRLQTDPTVIYGLGENFDGNLTRQNLREKTPYNTYRIDGLPPTPIALVGLESLDAVMHPRDTNALYFVAKGDGSHAFSETLEEHNRNVRRYQLGLRE